MVENYTPKQYYKDGYDPWKKTEAPLSNNYAIAAFIRISENGAKVGRSNDDYARYFNYEYGVYDPIKYHKQVIAAGYLVEASPEIALRKLKVAQLKTILVNEGLPNSGKKDALVSRIIDNVDISSLALEKYYIPSDKGLEHLKKYDYVFRLPRYGISWEEFDKHKTTSAHCFNPNDIIWQILNERNFIYDLNSNYGYVRNNELYMARLLEDEERYTDALFHYCLLLYYDVNESQKGETPDKPEDIILAPGIIEAIYNLRQYYISKITSKCYDSYMLPRYRVSRESFERILFCIFEGKEIDMKNYIKSDR